MQFKFDTKNRSYLKLLVIVLLIMLGNLNFLLSSSNFINSPSNYSNFGNFNLPKTNAGEITIITPENVTYTKAMSGYYPATYGYENDLLGTIPRDWLDESVYSSCSISVYNQKDDHMNVVRIYDANTGTGADAVARYDFESPKVNGTVEFWVYKESGSAALVIQGTDGSSAGFQMTIDAENNGVFRYAHAPSTYTEFADGKYADQEWFHLRIDFNCDTDTADYYLNGIKEVEDGSFHVPVSQVSYLIIRSGHSGHSGVMYFDAVSFSWDSNYNVGDNRFEGLLLSFHNSTNLDMVEYSLDNQANKTILGNTSITMPDPGLHRIQVFGNDSLGTMYQSSIRHFSISPINLITPENKTYLRPINGYYPATYGFENDTIGSEPSGLDKSVDAGCSLQVIGEIDGHKNVVEFDDQSNTGRAEFIIENSYWAASNTFEFYWRVTDASNYFACGIYYNSPNQRAIFKIESDKFQYFDGTYYDVGFTASDNTWYHIKVIHTVANWYLYIDGMEYGPFGYQAAGGIMNGYHFVTSGVATNYKGYIDALGFNADPNYAIGSNLDEGLLLSYSNNINVDWVGYSSDNQPNRTISGNTALVLPNNGLHNIQLFANDTSGTIYKSDLRYFTVDLSAPTISVITPQVDQYYGINAPSFNVDIQGFNLNKRWYSLDNGITNISFLLVTGSISQSEWNKFAHGPVQIRFYVNDSFNQIGYDLVTINKDLNAPSTEIFFVPYSGINRVISSTPFLLSATDNSESGVSTIQYKIGSSAWIPYTGAFTLSGYGSGFHTITYQSIDAVGNVETEKSIVIELYIPVPPPDNPNLIPLLLISIGIGIGAALGITIFFLIRKRTRRTPMKSRTDEKTVSGSDQLKVCPFCYAQIKINNKYCTLCGASLEKQ